MINISTMGEGCYQREVGVTVGRLLQYFGAEVLLP